jgi:hypothetical protein
VPSKNQPTKEPVGLEGATARFDASLSAAVSGVKRSYVQAKLPGEVSGDAVLVDLALANSSSATISLENLVVNGYDADGAPGNRVTSEPAVAMPDVVAGGQTVRGRFVFVMPKATSKAIQVEVSVSAADPVLRFEGSTGS